MFSFSFYNTVSSKHVILYVYMDIFVVKWRISSAQCGGGWRALGAEYFPTLSEIRLVGISGRRYPSHNCTRLYSQDGRRTEEFRALSAVPGTYSCNSLEPPWSHRPTDRPAIGLTLLEPPTKSVAPGYFLNGSTDFVIQSVEIASRRLPGRAARDISMLCGEVRRIKLSFVFVHWRTPPLN